MVSVLLIWVYIFITTFFCGSAFLCLISGNKTKKRLKAEDSCFAGIMLSTVYAQIFSLFCRVALAANIILLSLTALSVIYLIRKKALSAESFGLSQDKKKNLFFVLTVLLLSVIMSYGCSRGYFHYDSALYHGQSIRWIEEYGTVKGLALLHMRLGYNSSSFALSALYSFSFMGGPSFHAVQGFLALLLLFKCLRVFRVFKDKKIRISDIVRIGGFYYLFNIYDELVAPASDYFAMISFIYCIILSVDIYERCTDEPDADADEAYVFPALLCVFIPTVKLSTAPAVLIVFIPLLALIRSKRFGRIFFFGILSLIIALPLFIRNIIISGRLFYPSTALDIFDPAWKIPESVALTDSAYIVGFGRGYTIAEAADYPFTQWFPNWFSSLGRTDLIIFMICLVSVLILPLSIILRKGVKSLHVIELTATVSFLFWLLSSPLVRYGMGFLLILPPLMFGDLADIIIQKTKEKKSAQKFIRLSFCVLLLGFLGFKCLSTLKYIYQTLPAPYYLLQRDYEEYDCRSVNVDGCDIYVPLDGDQTGYRLFPATPSVMDGLHLAGDDLKDGFILR